MAQGDKVGPVAKSSAAATTKLRRKRGPGYHLRSIKKGTLGELSKLVEELEELRDASEQGCKIMELVELADLYGAMALYVERKFGMTMADLATMSAITRRAFENGHR
jgi:hypothetical protein